MGIGHFFIDLQYVEDYEISRLMMSYEKGIVHEGYYFCGYTYTVPAGEARTVTTTFRKL